MSLGFEAKNRIASVILVYPANRKTASAVLCKAAKTWGMLPVLAFSVTFSCFGVCKVFVCLRYFL